MSFNYPLALLALLAIPVLVLIYIIKNRYTEQVIASTYLWTLSERFLKRKNPINRIAGILSLILQILTVVLIALALAQPVFTLDGAAEDYLFIIDGSGSMNIQADGESRLDKAKSEVGSIINSSANGSTYSIVYATDTADVVCESLSGKNEALTKLDSISPAYGTMGTAVAMSKAQEVFDANPAVKIYFITDKSYESSTNVEIINVGSGEINYAVSDVEYSTSGSSIVVTANLWSYTGDASLTAALYVDGSSTPADTKTVDVTELEASAVSFEYGAITFTSLRVALLDDDGLSIDNESIIYNALSDSTYSVLLVSDSPFFIESALTSLVNVNVKTVSTSEYTGLTGYGLYIFDGYSPDVLPSDGAVWFINPTTSVSQTGFTVQSTAELTSPGALTYSSSTSTRVKELLNGVSGATIYISKYVKCGFSRNFYTLMSYSGEAVLFAGTNGYGNREAVFAFDLHDSDIAVTPDFVVLVSNLLNYTFPEIVSGTSYYCGDSVTVNVLAGCDSIQVLAPSGAKSYLDTGSDYAEYELDEVGTYTITVNINGTTRQVYLFSNLAMEERYVTATAEYFVITGEPSTETRDGIYDELLYLFIILAVLFIADWGVYCYEQYQLR